jgi:hypothetical protein
LYINLVIEQPITVSAGCDICPVYFAMLLTRQGCKTMQERGRVMRRSVLIVAVAVLLFGLGVILVRADSNSQIPPPSLQPDSVQINPDKQAKKANTPPAVPNNGKFPLVLTSENRDRPLRKLDLPPAPDFPGASISASARIKREPMIADKKPDESKRFDPQWLSATPPPHDLTFPADLKAPPAPETWEKSGRSSSHQNSLDYVWISESFEADTNIPWAWSQAITNTGYPAYTWQVDSVGNIALDGSNVADINYDPSLSPQDEWLISPSIDLTEGGRPWTLSFWWEVSYLWAVELNTYDLELRISTNGGVTWDPTVLWVEDSVGVFVNYAWYRAVIDLSPYLSYSSVKFAWRYAGVDGAYAALDLITLADCHVTPQPGDLIEVAENPADTTFYRTDPDGGCNSTPYLWNDIECGASVYGSCFTYDYYGMHRDTDWFLFTLTEPRWVRATVTAEFPVQVILIDTVCAMPYQYAFGRGDMCDEVVVDAGCLPAGTYALWVGPSTNVGIASPMAYRATFECGTCSSLGETCENAIIIPGLPYHVVDSTNGHVNDYDEGCPYSGSYSRDVVYEFSPDADMLLTVDMCPSLYDTKVYIYEGSCNYGTAIACNDDGDCGMTGYQSYLEDVPLTRWLTYYIVVDGYGSQNGTYDLTITADAGRECQENTMLGFPVVHPDSVSDAITSDANSPFETAQKISGLDYFATEIRFWGLQLKYNPGWTACVEEDPDIPFLISWYADSAGIPGAKLCEEYVLTSAVPTGDIYLGWPAYEYSATIGAPCQIGSGWLSIQGGAADSCWFLWLTSDSLDTRTAMRSYNGGSWTEVSSTLALCLSGDSIPAVGCPLESSLYSQSPTPIEGVWNVAVSEYPTNAHWLAENYNIPATAVTGIRFWGNQLTWDAEPCGENPVPFTIMLQHDSLGWPGPAACTYNLTLTGAPTGHFYDGLPLYEYTALFPSPCPLNNGWISVRGGGDEPCRFAWLNSPTGDYRSVYWEDGSGLHGLPMNCSMCLFGDTLTLPDCPADSTVFGQIPSSPLNDQWAAFISDSTRPYLAADDFHDVYDPITEIHFWGMYNQYGTDCIESPMTAQISFHEDSLNYPGSIIHSYVLDITPEPTGLAGFAYDFIGPIFHHQAVLPEPLLMTDGWISIQDISDSYCTFAWMTSGERLEGSARQLWTDQTWHVLNWDLSLCLISGEGVALITGLVYYHENDSPVAGLIMDILPGDSVATIGTGAYDFPDLTVGTTYQVTPSCSSEVDCDDAISFYDASLAARSAIGLITMDEMERRAADVSGNGNVTFYDAALIAQYAIGSIADFPSPCRWQFEPSQRLYDPLLADQYAQDYEAICLGDVSHDWAPVVHTEAPLPIASTLSLRPGGTVAAKNVIEHTAYSIQFDCSYNPTRTRFVGAMLTEGLDDWHLYTREEAGIIHIGAFGTSPVEMTQEIVLLRFAPLRQDFDMLSLEIDGYRIPCLVW